MASSGINVKMGVEGLSEFKRSIKGAQTSIKTLDQQLALNEKQFKATGDAEAYMQEKADLLDKKLQEQKGIVAQAEKALQEMTANGVKSSDEAYQKMWQNLAKAKGDLLDTEMAMRQVGASGEEAAGNVSDMNNQLKRIGDGVNWQNVTGGIEKITAGLEKVAKKAYSVGKAIVKEVLGTGGWADDINTRSKVLGVSTDELQRMEKTATIIDTDAETIIKARQKLMRGVGNGTAGTMDALEALGISYNGDAEDAFWKAGEAIMALGDEAEQEARASALFGKSWHDLIPLFGTGREEYDRMNATWNVMSQEQLDALNQMDDEYQKLQIAIEDLKREALGNLAEPMQKALESINGILDDIGNWLNSDEGKATVENVVTGITDSLKWIIDNKDGVITVMGAIATGFGAMKLAGGALQMLQLANGLKGIRGGSAAGSGVGSGLLAGAGGFIAKAAPWAVGLGVLTKNAFTPQGNDDIWDENGNPTELGRELGYTWTLEQDRMLGNIEAAEARNERWRQNVNALERMQAVAEDLSHANEGATRSTSEMTQAANDLKGLPALIAAAVEDGMSRVRIVVDVDGIANAVTPRVGSNMAGQVKYLIK